MVPSISELHTAEVSLLLPMAGMDVLNGGLSETQRSVELSRYSLPGLTGSYRA